MSDQLKRLNINVTGRVQGVGFRMFVQKAATSLNLTGYVRNDPQDRRRVEVVAEGQPSELEKLLKQVEKGPIGSRVEAVETGWEPAQTNFPDFRVT